MGNVGLQGSWQSKNALGGVGGLGEVGKGGRVGGALGGHYTDRSPQPLTNLDLALLARSSSSGEILEASLRPQSENTNTKTCFHFFHSDSSNDATLGKKGNKVLELPPLLSFHFISLPRTTRRAHLDLRLGPRV